MESPPPAAWRTQGTTNWAPGWYPQPGSPGLLRWFDGQQWTAHTWPTSPATAAPPRSRGTLTARDSKILFAIGLLSWIPIGFAVAFVMNGHQGAAAVAGACLWPILAVAAVVLRRVSNRR